MLISALKVIQLVQKPRVDSLPLMTSTGNIKEIKISEKNFTHSLGDQTSQSPLRNVKKSTACTNAMVSFKQELATNVLTTTYTTM